MIRGLLGDAVSGTERACEVLSRHWPVRNAGNHEVPQGSRSACRDCEGFLFVGNGRYQRDGTRLTIRTVSTGQFSAKSALSYTFT
jgi:hypothetical protein